MSSSKSDHSHKTVKVKKYKDVKVIQESSSDSSGHGTVSHGTVSHGTVSYGALAQEHAKSRLKAPKSSVSRSSMETHRDVLSNTSLTSSISRFRNDFDQFKGKMRIFGESLNLCRCIASDFTSKLTAMEKRLVKLEKRQRLFKTASNYSAIIQKNKLLSNKTLKDAKENIRRSLIKQVKEKVRTRGRCIM